MSFSVTEENFFGLSAYRLENTETKEFALITLRGATLLRLVIRSGDRLIDVIDGYKTTDELLNWSGARSAVMVPFSNKIKNNKFNFMGSTYHLSDNESPPVMHGFLKDLNLKFHYSETSHDYGKLILYCDEIRDKRFTGYPFDIDIRLTFELRQNKLPFCIEGKNICSTDAPYAAGWHPYFRIGDTAVEDHIITLDSECIIKTDADYIPLDGDEAYEVIEITDSRCFSSQKNISERRVGDKKINYCYSRILRESEGFIKASLISEKENTKLSIKHNGEVFYIFTGDGLPVRGRNSIAVEPVELMTNAFNRAECCDKIRLSPNSSKIFNCELEWNSL